MPIPLVFGTEHEYVINVPDASLPLEEKWFHEKIMAIALLQDFWLEFFPDIADDPYFIREREVTPDAYDDPRGRVLPWRKYDAPSDRVTLTAPDFVGGFMTPLGSRFYIDHGYFEGSSPECDDPFVLLACEMAQEELLVEAFQKLFADHPLKPRLYKNVSDGQGHSQAAHRNFCVSAGFWPLLVSHYARESYIPDNLTRETRLLMTWHVVEQIFTGAGKYGDEMIVGQRGFSEEELKNAQGVFQLSGRADFAYRLVGAETTHWRPIVNQRYEPLADHVKYSRYHCICGDANRAEWPHLFKMGLTALVLGMIDDDQLDLGFYVKDPHHAIRDVSRDPTCKKPVGVVDYQSGRAYELSPLEIMNVFLKKMERYIGSRSLPAWAGRIHEKALSTAWALEHEPRLLGTVLDWKIKELLGDSRPNAFRIHLNYHSLAGPNMLYRKLVESGAVETVIEREDIAKYKKSPPETTRAYFRGKFIGHFYRDVDHFITDWDQVVLRTNDQGPKPKKIILDEPLGLTRKECGHIFEGENSPSLEHFENMFVIHDFNKNREASYDGPRPKER